MAQNIDPIFGLTPNLGLARLTAANTNIDDPTASGAAPTLLLTAGANGTRLESVHVQAAAATTAGFVRVWILRGAAYRLYAELAIAAATPSASVAAAVANLSSRTDTRLPLLLVSGDFVYVTTNNAETFHVEAVAADF